MPDRTPEFSTRTPVPVVRCLVLAGLLLAVPACGLAGEPPDRAPQEEAAEVIGQEAGALEDPGTAAPQALDGEAAVVPQGHPQCRQLEANLAASLGSVPFQTKRDAERRFPAVKAAVQADALRDPLATRNGILQSVGDSRLQNLIVLRMQADYCELIWSRPGRTDAEQLASLTRVTQSLQTRALAFTPVARTDSAAGGRRDGDGASDGATGLFQQAAYGAATARRGTSRLQEPSDYLRDPPYYINDENKWFVIVASPSTEAEGRRLMARFKARAPQYDFVLYAPYGANPSYGIMMATWVSRSVALRALADARRDVAPDAFLWSCRGSGDRC